MLSGALSSEWPPACCVALISLDPLRSFAFKAPLVVEAIGRGLGGDELGSPSQLESPRLGWGECWEWGCCWGGHSRMTSWSENFLIGASAHSYPGHCWEEPDSHILNKLRSWGGGSSWWDLVLSSKGSLHASPPSCSLSCPQWRCIGECALMCVHIRCECVFVCA